MKKWIQLSRFALLGAVAVFVSATSALASNHQAETRESAQSAVSFSSANRMAPEDPKNIRMKGTIGVYCHSSLRLFLSPVFVKNNCEDSSDE